MTQQKDGVRERLTRKERDRQDLKDARIAIAEAKKKGTVRGSEVKQRLDPCSVES
jgi:hypothetical protein